MMHDVAEHLRTEYDGVFDEEMLGHFIREYVEPGEAARLLADVMATAGPSRLLDVGCGYGAFVLVAREAGFEAVGIELAAFEVEFARRRLMERLPSLDPDDVYVEGDACALPFDDEMFDTVTMWNVIEHIPDYERALAEAVRVLRPGGRLIGVAPNYASFRREPHYQVAWCPLLPKSVAARYLRVRGRNPRFLLEQVYYRTMGDVRRVMSSLPVRTEDPRLGKLEDPRRLANPRFRRFVEWSRRAHVLGLLRTALVVEANNPLRARIDINAVKEPRP